MNGFAQATSARTSSRCTTRLWPRLAGASVTDPFSITVAFSQPVTGFELKDLVVGNGSASELQGNNANYTATITPAASAAVTVAIPARAAQDALATRARPRCSSRSSRT